MAFVSESLDKFLAENFTREEDEWANKEIDRHERGVPAENAGTDEILTDPEGASSITTTRQLQEELAKLTDYLQGRELSGEEFANICNWVGDMKNEIPAESLMTVMKMFISKNDYIMEDLFKGGQEYSAGLELLMQKFGSIE